MKKRALSIVLALATFAPGCADPTSHNLRSSGERDDGLQEMQGAQEFQSGHGEASAAADVCTLADAKTLAPLDEGVDVGTYRVVYGFRDTDGDLAGVGIKLDDSLIATVKPDEAGKEVLVSLSEAGAHTLVCVMWNAQGKATELRTTIVTN